MKKIFNKMKSIIKGKNKIIIGALVAVLLIMLAPIQKIEVGYQGILYNTIRGDISANKTSGWHIVIPFFQDLTSYPVNDRTYKIYRDNKEWNNGVDASIVTPTKDNQKISIDATFVYILDKDKLPDIYEKFNGEDIEGIEQNYLYGVFKSTVINTVAKYTAYDVYSIKREEIQNVIFTELSKKLTDSNIILRDVYLDTIRLSEETESIIRAEALAEAARIEAQGKSDANKLISESLTDEIMTYESLQKMSESLKLIVVPSGSENQLDLTKIFEEILKGSNEADSSSGD